LKCSLDAQEFSDGTWVAPPAKDSFQKFIRIAAGGLEVYPAGTPLLREPAVPIKIERIKDADVQEVIENMVELLRGPNVPGSSPKGVGLSAPQIGVPSQIIVLEDIESEIEKLESGEAEKMERRPFACKVIINPTVTPIGSERRVFFEGCLSVPGYRGLVERALEVEVTGWDAAAKPVKFRARGWEARILQHEYDHLQGVLYVDRMYTRSFRRVDKLSEPLPPPCAEFGITPKPGPVSSAKGFNKGASKPSPPSFGASGGAEAAAEGGKPKGKGKRRR